MGMGMPNMGMGQMGMRPNFPQVREKEVSVSSYKMSSLGAVYSDAVL